MTGQAEKATAFLGLHRGESPWLLPNPRDAGSAKLLASLGFRALATTSSGFPEPTCFTTGAFQEAVRGLLAAR